MGSKGSNVTWKRSAMPAAHGVVRNHGKLTPERQAIAATVSRLSVSLRPTMLSSAVVRPVQSQEWFAPAPSRAARQAVQRRVLRARYRREHRLRIAGGRTLRYGRIKPVTLERYRKAVKDFRVWCEKRRLKCVSYSQTDAHLASYFDHSYYDGFEASVGRNARAGWILLETYLDGDKGEHFPQSRAALRGWEKLAPTRVRPPLPILAAFAILYWLVSLGTEEGVEAARVGLLQRDTYGRPSSILELVAAAISGPISGAGAAFSKSWAVDLSLSDAGLESKTGTSDDHIVLGSREREYTKSIMRALVQRSARQGGSLFKFTLSKYERLFARAVKALGFGNLKACPHALRHCGPSHDAWKRYRTVEEIQRRGCWRVRSSCNRYEKHGMLLRQLARMTFAQRQSAQESAKRLPGVLLAAVTSLG